MPTDQELQLRVSLIDEASAGIAKLRDELRQFTTGEAKKNLERIKQEQAEFGKQIKELGELAASGGRGLTSYIGKFGAAGAAFGGFAASLGVGLHVLKDYADKIVDLTNKAKVIGMNPAELKSIIQQYERLGISASTTEKSLAGFSGVLADINRIGSKKRMEMIEAAGAWSTLMIQGIERVQAQSSAADKLTEVLLQAQNVYDNRLRETNGNIADATKSENEFLKLWDLDPSVKVLRRINNVSEAEQKRMEQKAKQTSDYNKALFDLKKEWESWSNDIKTSALGADGYIVSGLKTALDLVKQLHALWNRPWVVSAPELGMGKTAVPTPPPAPQVPIPENLPDFSGPQPLLSSPTTGGGDGFSTPGFSKGWEWMRRSENIEDRRDENLQGDDYQKSLDANTAEMKRLNDNFKLLGTGEIELKGLGGLPGFGGRGGGGGVGGGGGIGGGGIGGGGVGGGGGIGAPNGSSVGPGSGSGAGSSNPATGTGGGTGGTTGGTPPLQPGPAPGGGSTPITPEGKGALADQANRPYYYGGTVTIGGKEFHYGTGGGGRGSVPYGTFPINPGDMGPIGRRIGAYGSVGGMGGHIPDPRFPGAPREGILIHSASSSNLDKLYSQGCFAVSRAEWPAFKQALIEETRKSGPMSLTIGRDGRASILPRETAEVRRTEQKTATAPGAAPVQPGSPPAATPPSATQAVTPGGAPPSVATASRMAGGQGQFKGGAPKELIVHYTGGISHFTGEQYAAAASGGDPYMTKYHAQLFMDEHGKITRVVPQGQISYHAGPGNVTGEGMEIATKHGGTNPNLKGPGINPEQRAALRQYYLDARKAGQYPSGVRGHSEVTPGHRENEGEFEAKELRQLETTQTARATVDGAAKDKSVRTVKVESDGKLTADVNAPKGTSVSVEGGGAFKKTETNRTMPIEAD
jgi:N-acetylmuramoyl-L-alanine amidase-like protein